MMRIQPVPQQSGPATVSPGAMRAVASYDAVGALNQQVDALKQENAVLKARLDKLEAAVGKLDAGLGQMTTINVSQAQQINSLNSQMGALSGLPDQLANLDARFKAHKHTYQRAQIGFMNRYFVTSSHLNGDDKDLASYININTANPELTTAPVN